VVTGRTGGELGSRLMLDETMKKKENDGSLDGIYNM